MRRQRRLRFHVDVEYPCCMGAYRLCNPISPIGFVRLPRAPNLPVNSPTQSYFSLYLQRRPEFFIIPLSVEK